MYLNGTIIVDFMSADCAVEFHWCWVEFVSSGFELGTGNTRDFGFNNL